MLGRSSPLRVLLIAGAGALATGARDARGQESAVPVAKDVSIEVGGQVTYLSPPIRGGTNPFGLGFGGRIGLTLSGGFYLGARVTDYLGGRDVDVSYRSLLVGAETGYGWRIPLSGTASLVLRPQIGLGNASIYYVDPSLRADVVTSASSASSGSDTLTVNSVYVEPGLAAVVSSAGHFASVKSTALVIPSITYGGAEPTNWVCYGVEAQLGFVF
jgi:hypothetical protein